MWVNIPVPWILWVNLPRKSTPWNPWNQVKRVTQSCLKQKGLRNLDVKVGWWKISHTRQLKYYIQDITPYKHWDLIWHINWLAGFLPTTPFKNCLDDNSPPGNERMSTQKRDDFWKGKVIWSNHQVSGDIPYPDAPNVWIIYLHERWKMATFKGKCR